MAKEILKIEIPEGFELDIEHCTPDNVKFRKKVQVIKTWEDLIGTHIPESSKFIDHRSNIGGHTARVMLDVDKNMFIDDRHAKSALAMAQISQLMPYYGGAITDEEWGNSSTIKHDIVRMEGKLDYAASFGECVFLAFHTTEQRDKFLKYNRQIVCDYLMIKNTNT